MEDGKRNTKEAIIQTAQKLFAKFGMRKTAVDEIAEKAHVSKGSIYHHFRDKEDIFRSVIRREGETLIAKIWEEISKQANPQDKLQAMMKTKIFHYRNLVNLWEVSREMVEELLPSVEKERKRIWQEEKRMIARILQEGVEEKVFTLPDINMVAESIVSAFRNLEFSWTLEMNEKEFEMKLDSLLNILFKGLEAR